MRSNSIGLLCGPLAAVACLLSAVVAAADPPAPQYQFEDLQVPGAHAEEPVREFSVSAAADYLERGAEAWSKQRQCVSCHTNGSYLLTRPAITSLGRPSEEIREFFVAQLKALEATDPEKLRRGLKPTQTAYLAAGLAQWDRHVAKQLSPETQTALELMFGLQAEDGSFSNLSCWPPLESSAYHGATVAATATAAAPGWRGQLADKPQLAEGVERLQQYLRRTKPPHDYARVLLLWTAASWPDLIDRQRRQSIEKMITSRQQPDGGWSLRQFATPESWGGGNRADKLRAEPDFQSPPSDGHMTGLAMIALMASGADAEDPRIRRGAAWLKANQRQSGRWWTRSLNTDTFHFITYSGTCYPLLALHHCGELK